MQATFFLEQHLGHQTYYQNLRQQVQAQPLLLPRWVEISYTDPGSLFAHLPGPLRRFRGTLIGREQVIHGAAQPYDVAFFNTQVPAALAFARIRRKPYLLSTDITPVQYDSISSEYGHAVDRLKVARQIKHRINCSLFQQAAFLLPWSNWVRASLISDYGADPQKIFVIPPGIDVERWQPKPRPQNTRLRILFVGGDFWRKGGAFLLELYQTLPRQQVEFVIVTRSEIASAEGLTVHQNMRPNTPELIALYQSCDVFLFPTQAEAFGIAAQEAAASGLPVVASNIGGLPDIVNHEKTGFLLPKNDRGAFCGAIEALIDQPQLRQEMSHAARVHAVAQFDSRKNAQKIQQLLLQAVKHTPPAP